MAGSEIIVDGDMIQVTINPPTVVPQLMAPVPLVATGFTTIDGKAACIEGDELPSSLKAPLQYTSPPFVIPGVGTLTVTLESANKTATAVDDGKKMLLKGGDVSGEVRGADARAAPPGGRCPTRRRATRARRSSSRQTRSRWWCKDRSRQYGATSRRG